MSRPERVTGDIFPPLFLQRRQQRGVLGEHAEGGADRIGGERMDQRGFAPHQRHHDLAAGLEPDSRSDLRRDHHLALQGVFTMGTSFSSRSVGSTLRPQV